MSTNQNNKKQFFWEHMLKDIRIAAKALSINQDELITLLHIFCEDILKSGASMI
jgi:hypothetical protein